MSKLGKKLIAAAHEGIAIARGETNPRNYYDQHVRMWRMHLLRSIRTFEDLHKYMSQQPWYW